MNTTQFAYLYVHPEAVFVCVLLTVRQTVLRLCRRSRASWGLARYWGSSAWSSRMENGTMEPGQEGEGGAGGVQEQNRRQKEKMFEGKGKIRNRVG